MKKHLVRSSEVRFVCLLLALLVSLFVVASPVRAQTNAIPPLATQLQEQARASGDSQLPGLATDLTAKMESFGQMLGGNPEVKTALDDILKSFTGGKDSAALASAFKLTAGAKLTPEQTGLAKEVGNLASAYAVQKNFASLDGAQSDVARLVNSLRKGELTSAMTPLQNIGKNAKLSAGQKELFNTLANNYAPGLKSATESLKKVKIPGF
jgi:hypothetical protein